MLNHCLPVFLLRSNRELGQRRFRATYVTASRGFFLAWLSAYAKSFVWLVTTESHIWFLYHKRKPLLAGSRVLAQPEVKPFPFYICRDATKCVLLSFFCLIESVCSKIWAKPLPKNAKSPLPVDVCGPKRHPFVVCVYRWAWFYFSPSMLERGFQFYVQFELVRLSCSQ